MTPDADARWLSRALGLAATGGRATAPNPRVGCVVVRDGDVAGEGWHARAGEAHAEAIALERAGDAACGATLYVSLEPCDHEGRTPPCARAIVAAGVRRVVLGMVDPDPRVQGRGIETLRRGGVEVEIADGALADRAREVLEDYLVHRLAHRAFALLKVAATLDGRIADRDGMSRWITGPRARSHGRALRERYQAILVGAGTIAADDPRLLPPDGESGGPFLRAIVDPKLRTDPAARVFEASWSPVLVFADADAPADRRERLEAAGAEVVCVSADEGGLRIQEILECLGRREVLGVIVEGGGRTHARFLAASLADRVNWYLSPTVLGDGSAVAAVDGPARRLVDRWNLELSDVTHLGDDLLLSLRPARGPDRA